MKRNRLTRLTMVYTLLVMLLALAGCGNSLSTGKSSDATGVSSQAVSDKATGKKILVVYFSAEGHTKHIAEVIAEAAGADTMMLEADPAYTKADLDYHDTNSRTSKELHDESLRNIALKQAVPEHWSEYDTVFIGYPIWWGVAAWPVNTFITSNSFQGKTVIPFCTSKSSPIGASDENLKDLADGGDWKPGIRFSPSASNQEIYAWLIKALSD